MLKQVYKIDTEGFLIEPLIKNFYEDGNCTEELPDDIITVDPPNGLYRPKWTGTEWISSMTEAEYIATLPEIPQEPTEIEALRLEQAQANAELIDLILALTGGM